MFITKIGGIRSAAPLCLASVLGATASLQVGCGDMMAGLPGPARMAVENMLGLDLSFEIAGAPSDEVEQVFFYLKNTSRMTSQLRSRTETLAGQFAILFGIEANARTEEGLAKIAGAAKKIDASTMTSDQKQWVKNNMNEFAGLAYAMVGIAKSLTSIVTAATATIASDKVSSNPSAVLRYFSGSNALAAAKGALVDVKSLALDIPPIAENLSGIASALTDLGKAEGLEAPTEEESKRLADASASSAIGDDVTFS